MKLSSYQHLVKEWHPTKNGKLTPEDFTHGTKKKAWWLCPNGHSYYATIGNRTKNNTGCPYCSGNKVGENNNLLAKFPEVAKEWHPTKNGKLTPEDFTHGSKKKVWWLCSKGHSYEATPNHRTCHKSGCPYCSGRLSSKGNNLKSLYPKIAEEWHPTKNGDLTADKATPASSKKVWWLCPKGHSYDIRVAARTKQNQGCPYCSGKRVSNERSLLTLYPEVAKEWHPTKNGRLTPNDLTYGSRKEVWWLCPKGHSYKKSVQTKRTQKYSCPYCVNQSSEPEIRILSELKWLFDAVKSRHRIKGKEIDIFIPSINLGIEYDGSYWHKNKENTDLKKNKFLLSKGIYLIRVRHSPLKQLSENDVIVSSDTLKKSDIDNLFKNIYLFVDEDKKEAIDKYIKNKSFVNNEIFKIYRSYFPSPFPENSLISTHPMVSSEWDYDRNYPLTPENFTYGSNNKVWWICPKGHSYNSTIVGRASGGFRCPYCDGKIASNDYNLLVKFPEIAKEWHPTKNGDLTPDKTTHGSKQKIWWLCSEGHSYQTRINTRTSQNSGCPYCAGKQVSKENNLLVKFPEIAKEWHPTKNGALKPKDIVYGSSKQVWWLCDKGHSFKASVNRRTSMKTNCPYCSGKRSLTNDLFG